MNPVVTSSYDPVYIALSFAMAVIGSFIALTAARRLRRADGSLSFPNMISAGVALGGIGVWSMHFVGMLALRMDVASSYSMTETAISLLAAIVASSIALAFVAQAPDRFARIAGAGALLGLSVAVMHYLGMFGLKINGYVQWNYAIIALSIAIAIVAAIAALWLAFNTSTLAARGIAAVVMGVAVCAMHYTGMEAAKFICTTTNRVAIPQGIGYISSFSLSGMVIAAAVTMSVLLAMDQYFQQVVSKGRAIPVTVRR
jgi:NO-binding membrane sensor protein with MHYT domain